MTTQEVANRLVSLCRQGQFKAAYNELYAEDIHSIEPMGEPREVKGIEAVRGKGDYFEKTVEVHSLKVSDPVVAGNHFSISMKLDATSKETGQPMPMDEICVYEVTDGKVSKEQFFYPGQG